jgi:Ca2+-transporting ATPase
MLSVALQCAVLYTPFLQQAFSTVGLTAADWLQCLAVASSVLWLREVEKLVYRLRLGRRERIVVRGAEDAEGGN